MRLVQENTDEEIRQQRALREITWPLRELAANMMRVSRGAGRPYDIGRQCVSVIEAFQHYRDVCGLWPSSDEISEAIDQSCLYPDREWDELEDAVETIMCGGLQLAASRLMGQSTQQAAGKAEIARGINSREEAIEKRNREFAKKYGSGRGPAARRRSKGVTDEEWKE